VHSKFSADLQAAKSSSSASSIISSCFTNAKASFLIYAEYCSNLLSAQDLLESLCEHSPTVGVKVKVSDLSGTIVNCSASNFAYSCTFFVTWSVCLSVICPSSVALVCSA